MGRKPKDKLEAPQGKGRVIVRRAGEPFPPFRLAVPELEGPSLRLAFRADAACIDLINEHIERLADAYPGTVITASDGMRDLMRLGAEAARQADKDTEDE